MSHVTLRNAGTSEVPHAHVQASIPKHLTSTSATDHRYRVCETCRPQEGHERDLQGEVPSYQTDIEQN